MIAHVLRRKDFLYANKTEKYNQNNRVLPFVLKKQNIEIADFHDISRVRSKTIKESFPLFMSIFLRALFIYYIQYTSSTSWHVNK